ncbi:hypothetical protein [Clostridium sp.]|uniref:terminase gpP N-terminus-related DNA-binding protein n=1 Tax=Clostridium sp. TaxID=1506 RepID=UPI00344EA5BA
MVKEKYELAEEDYLKGMKYKEIAEKYEVSINTVKSWKTRYSWSKDKKGAHTKSKKVCTQNDEKISVLIVECKMIKSVLKLIIEVLGKRLIKAGLEETLLKHQNYITAAKEVSNIVEENFRIRETIQEKISSKADEFDKLLLAKFPELTSNDVAELRQAVAGEINQGKDVVLSQVDALKQLQDSNTSLQVENASLKDQLSKVQAAVQA